MIKFQTHIDCFLPPLEQNALGSFLFQVDFIRQIIRCMQEADQNQSTFINCCWSGHRAGIDREKPVPSIVLVAELMHARVPPSHRSTQQERDHHSGGVHTHAHTQYMKGRGGALCLIWLKAVSGGAGWVEDCAWRSMKVLSCNMSHRREGPTGLWKSAKSCCQDCSRCETTHSSFYYPLSHIYKDSNPAKEQETDPLIQKLSPKWKQLHAINVSRHVWFWAVLITDGWSNFSSASEGRFLFKRVMCSDGDGFEELPRCHTNPVECLRWTEGLWDCQSIAWPIKGSDGCQLYAYGAGKSRTRHSCLIFSSNSINELAIGVTIMMMHSVKSLH